MGTAAKKHARLVYALLAAFFLGTVLFNVFWQKWAQQNVVGYSFHWGELLGVALIAGAVTAMLVILYRRQLEMERWMELENAHLATLTESIPLALVEVEPGGHIVRMNGAAESLFDVIGEDLCNQPVDTLADFALDPHRQGGLLQALEIDFDQPGQRRHARLGAIVRNGHEVKLDVDSTVVEVPSAEGAGTRPLALLVFRDVTREEAVRRRILHLAYYDQLTRLLNRTGLVERMQEVIANMGEQDAMALIVIDIRRFRELNELLGHHTGDRLLKIIAHRLRGSVRARNVNLLARTGSNEFAVMLLFPGRQAQQADVTEQVDAVCRRILDRLTEPYEVDEREKVRVKFNLGVSLAQKPVRVEELLRQADLALDISKQDAENVCHFYTESMEKRLVRIRWLEHALVEALQKDQFHLVYQPQLDARTGALVGSEALIRWVHPEEGFIPPDEFIAVAERAGMIRDVGEWVIDQAIAQLAAWQGEPALRTMRIAINLSSVQLEDVTLLTRLTEKLKAMGLESHQLELELTERVVMTDAQGNVERFHAIRKHGFDLAVDDFGTGYSSLAYLQKFPLSVLKIDKQFVDHLPADEGAGAIARAIISLAHNLGMKVVAEGVENGEQLRWLREAGCDLLQGYYLGRPMEAEAFHQWVMTDYPLLAAKEWAHLS